MSDLISRQAAIDVVKGIDSGFVKYIEELPSAQPETIRLRLDHELSKEEYERLKKDCAEQPIILLPKESAPQWIPCSERLPENDDWQIVTILDEHGDTPYRYSDFGWYLDKAECWIIDAEQRTDVIAWMPLPEPYAERRTDE